MSIEVRSLPLSGEGWRAYLVPVSLSTKQYVRSALPQFIESITRKALEQHSLSQEVLLHGWKLHEESRGQLLQPHLPQWFPQVGMGVWPFRAAPALWNEESFMDAAASEVMNEEPELAAYRLMRIRGTVPDRREAASLLAGVGAVTRIFLRGSFEALEQQTRSVFLPRIQAAVYRHERFYLPLLDVSTLQAASADSELDAWLGPVCLYLRESAEDKGVLLVVRAEMAPLLSEAAAEAGIPWQSGSPASPGRP